MLSRHFLRSKVLQAIYAFESTHTQDPAEAQIWFERQIARLNDLGILQLSTLTQLASVAELIMEDSQKKFVPSSDDLNTSRRFIDNEFIARLRDNYGFKKQCERLHINWNNDEDVFRKAYFLLRKQPTFVEYLNNENQSYDEDRTMALNAFKLLMNEESVRALFIDKSLLWEDDFDQIAQYNLATLKTIEDLEFDETMPCPLVFNKNNEKENDDMDFAKLLLITTLKNRQSNEDLIRKHLQNWEFERVALIDVILIGMALTEFTTCPTIPERVTVDEYIELSKDFSTSKSKLFINGILDKMLIGLRAEGKIEKSGRGLLTPEFYDDNQDE